MRQPNVKVITVAEVPQKGSAQNLFSVFVHIPFTIMSKKSSGELARNKDRSRVAALVGTAHGVRDDGILAADQRELKRITR